MEQFSIRLMQAEDAHGYHQLIASNHPYLEEYFPVTLSMTKSLEHTYLYVQSNLEKIERKEFYRS